MSLQKVRHGAARSLPGSVVWGQNATLVQRMRTVLVH